MPGYHHSGKFLAIAIENTLTFGQSFGSIISNGVRFTNKDRHMGIKERREREKQVTRQSILTAAHRIARQEGWPALTIRKVADEIEYSTPMIYEYFTNKEEI